MNNTSLVDSVYLAEASYADFSDKSLDDRKSLENGGLASSFATLLLIIMRLLFTLKAKKVRPMRVNIFFNNFFIKG